MLKNYLIDRKFVELIKLIPLHIHLNSIHFKDAHISELPDFVGVQQLHSSYAFVEVILGSAELNIFIICEQFSHLVHIRQSLSQLLTHIFCCLICCDTHWMGIVTDNILNESLIGTLTKKNTNSRVLMGFTHLVIKYFHVRLKLTYIGRFESSLL